MAIDPAPSFPVQRFDDAFEALDYIRKIYETNTAYIRESFKKAVENGDTSDTISACYPYVAVDIGRKEYNQHKIDRRLSHGFVSAPGRYTETLTRPDIFGRYYQEQLDLLYRNHQVPIEVGVSDQPIPINFAYSEDIHLEGQFGPEAARYMRESFDLVDLSKLERDPKAKEKPLALFTAPRVDISLHRLRHYTGTNPANIQNFILFTNYPFYVEEFRRVAKEIMQRTDNTEEIKYRSQYTHYVEPGLTVQNANLGLSRSEENPRGNSPQMPGYHLVRKDGNGISLFNIGVGPSNAKTITDHLAVLRPHAWIMLGHCAGLRDELELGDYILAHAYVREDGVLDKQIPLNVQIPNLAEIQQALQKATENITGRTDGDIRKIMRTGTIVSTLNRHWELENYQEHIEMLNMHRAIALDMETATIAANGYRYCVPYGALLCVSDKPLQGVPKLPGMASDFYTRQTRRHLQVGIEAMEILRDDANLHSRKLSPLYGRVFL